MPISREKEEFNISRYIDDIFSRIQSTNQQINGAIPNFSNVQIEYVAKKMTSKGMASCRNFKIPGNFSFHEYSPCLKIRNNGKH